MSFHEILIPIVVAIVPSLFLLLSKKFEHAESSRAKMHEKINDLTERIARTEGDIQNIRGRLNGMTR